MSYFDDIWRVWVKGGAPSKWVEDAEEECRRILGEIEVEARERRARAVEKEYDRISREVREDAETRRREKWLSEDRRRLWRKIGLPGSEQLRILMEEETKMQKEYEYKAAKRTTIRPAGLVQYKPCAAEFGKFSVWYYIENSGDMKTDEQIVAKLVEEKRFGWLDWLATNTPFVTRTEKKAAYKFTPENLKLEYYSDGNAALLMDDGAGGMSYVFYLVPGEAVHRSRDCGRVPVRCSGDKVVVD